MRLALVSRTFLVLLVAWVVPRDAHAQRPIEAGMARDAKTKAPLQCLHVVLVDSSDRAVAHTVTDDAGQFSLEAPGAGAFRLRFEIFGWEPLAGPLDTLATGDFKQRAYPLAFQNILEPDTATMRGYPLTEQRKEAHKRLYAYLRGREDTTAWRSRQIVPGSTAVHYPPTLHQRVYTGRAIAQFVVDSSGKIRADSWQTVHATHDDFAKALHEGLPNARWKPALLQGRPVCELVRQHVQFHAEPTWRHIILSG